MNIIILAIILSNIFLGLLTLSRNTKSQVNISFFALNIFASVWIATNYFQSIAPQNIATTLVKLDFLTALFMTLSLFWFSMVFTDSLKRLPLRVISITYSIVISLLTTILILANGIISRVNFINEGVDVVPGKYYLGYSIVIISTVFVSILALLRAFKSASSYKKQQLRYVTLGLFLAAILLLLTNLILPRILTSGFAVTVIPQLGYLGLLMFLGFSTYAIVKHRMMDIRMVVARSVAYSLLLLILAGFYSSSIFFVQSFIFKTSIAPGYIASQIVLATAMAFMFQPLKRWITRVTDRIFFKEQYDTEDLLDQMAHTVGSTIILIEMLYKAIDLLSVQMRISRAMVVVFSDTGALLETQSVGYKITPKISTKELTALTKDGILVADELSEGSKYKKILQGYEASLAIPLKNEAGTEGVMLLGEKQSGDMFSANDLKVFEIVAPEIAVAIANAKSYEKIERFNVTLRQEIKKATHELEKKNEQLRELDKAKDEFISMASHQLRTPLTAIKGYLSMLLEGDAGEIKVSQYDFVNEAFQGANRMVGLINDLLNVSRMETGRFFLEPVEVNMEKLVDEEYKQLANHAKEKGLKFEVKIKGKIPHIWVDETKIRQVVMNFMDNAIYYTTQGTVTVTLSADKKHVIFEVLDTGIGVPKNQQKNLFTKFYRADNARHVRPDGTGLGIYLAKRVMDDHNGELIFHSVEGKGSTFGFKIPIKSELKIKRISAPQPGSHNNPGIGELAAGVGVPVETLEATQAVGIEAPLADSPDAQNNLTKIGIPTDRRGPDAAELEKTAKEQKESLEAVTDK